MFKMKLENKCIQDPAFNLIHMFVKKDLGVFYFHSFKFKIQIKKCIDQNIIF